ncbi:TonB-dependent receptor domain-containing protein [Halocynthiibacter styelae]|uniref:TonB-dependent receptor n=1 Tax=Halocynthiibacter styelae TaxID=2761955 RepID=A0A8J7LLK3_9RHOB|nr:TonB-dependent receptor [Paenihalocynthiibacter styelae]MBI1495515.1 TonB-dependent receptor [Paenihalocynthiibacter styelae]
MRFLKLTTCIILGMSPATVWAQDTAGTHETTDETVYLGTIVVSAPLNPEAEDGLSVTSEALALSNPADLSELFAAEPTLSVGGGIPMAQKLYVNGIEENNLAISIDGARQNNRVFHHNTTTLIDPSLLQAVRVDAGVAPADAGPGALAGALEYETKDVGDLLDPDDNFGGSLKSEYGSNGDVFSNSLTLYGRQGGFEALAFGRFATGNERDDGFGNEIIGSTTAFTSFLGKVAYESENGGRFEFSAEQVADDAARPYRANIGAIIGGRPVPPTRNYDLTRTNYSLEYTTTKSAAFWDPTLRLSYSGTMLINDELGTPADQYTEGETTSLNGEVSNRFALSFGELNAGVDFYSDETSLDYRNVASPAFNSSGGEKLDNVGVFAQFRMDPTANTRFSTGLRADFQSFEGIDGSTQSTDGVSYNVSGEIDLSDRVTLSAGYSHVWGGIELAENYILNPVWDYSASEIEDVTSDNIYVAASYDAGWAVLDGKIFSTEIDNSRAASYGGGPALTADVASKGFELGLSTNWDNGFVRIGYANIDTEVNGLSADSYNGNYLTMPLGEVVTLQAAHQFNNGVILGGNAEHTLDYTLTDTLYSSSVDIAGYTVVNTFVEYSPENVPGLTLRAEVNNIFDEGYVARATYGQDFPGEVEPLYEDGRSIRLSAQYTF